MALETRKIYIGPRLRRLRRDRGMTQAAMAEEIGISPSYLNLIERNQRPLSAQILLRLNETFDLDLKELSSGDSRVEASLTEVFRDPLFTEIDISRPEIVEMAETAPDMAGAVVSLYHAYRNTLDALTVMTERQSAEGDTSTPDARKSPIDETYEFFDRHGNYFDAVEAAAFAVRSAVNSDAQDLEDALRDYLLETHEITVQIQQGGVSGRVLRRFDPRAKKLILSEMLRPPSRTFHLAFQLGMIEHRELFDSLVAGAAVDGEEAERLCLLGLANYFAGAVMMPYDQFLDAAEAERYDIVILAHRFGASLEQVFQRLTTLQRPGNRGVPFFIIKIDRAGNVAKRFSASDFRFARFGGTCPRWNLHEAFQMPGKFLTQIVQLEEGATYFSISHTVQGASSGRGIAEQRFAIGLGCEISDAPRLIYSDGIDLDSPVNVMPIGLNCRMCQRSDCDQRAFPPVNRRVRIDTDVRKHVPYSFDD